MMYIVILLMYFIIITITVTFVLYIPIWQSCPKVIYIYIHIGETGTTIYERLQNHLSVIRKKEELLPTHFNQEDHSVEDMSIVGIQRMRTKYIHYRKLREAFWINKLNTIQPQGLNQNMGVCND